VSFRARLTLAVAVAVAVAVLLASLVVSLVVRDELRSEVDNGLRSRAETISQIELRVSPTDQPGQFFLHVPQPLLGGPGGYLQLVDTTGETARSQGETVALPIDSRVRAVASSERHSFFTDAHVNGVHVRVYTFPLASGVAGQLARPLTEVDRALHRISLWLLGIALGGIGLAAALGLVVSRAALAPVRRLTDTAEHVSATRDLRSRIAGGGRDELGRLAASFNRMLEALESAADSQRQLVADASHELRTPLTSLRTNIEVLARHEGIDPEEREHLLADVVEQLSEMSVLVSELVELARVDRAPHEPEEVRLDLLVVSAVERARRNAPGIHFETDLEESLVNGVADTLERAVANLLDNAAKWSPDGGPVEVTVRRGEVIVRDHGPGIDDEDLPNVFERFYRARAARGRPGSGLGLAIVRQVAEAHGGEVTAERADGGGTLMRLRLAPVPSRDQAATYS